MQARRDNLDPKYGEGYFIVITAPAPVPTRGLCNSANPPG
jgi:hypothetical protein